MYFSDKQQKILQNIIDKKGVCKGYEEKECNFCPIYVTCYSIMNNVEKRTMAKNLLNMYKKIKMKKLKELIK